MSELLIGLLLFAAPALARGAPFDIVRHDVRLDAERRLATFSLDFNQPPDFATVDPVGRPRHEFQYWTDADPDDEGDAFWGPDVAVIRGGEIRLAGRLPVRDSINDSGEEFPHAGGWGPMRGAVPVEIDGSAVSFTVPWSLLGESDGALSYRLIALEFGSTTSDLAFPDGATVIPLPAGACGGGVLLAGLGVFSFAARCRKNGSCPTCASTSPD